MLRTAVITILVVLEVIALYSMWVQIYQNGFFEAMNNLRSIDPDLLPCPYLNLHTKYTHIYSFDQAIVGLECAFNTIVDGSNPTLSLWAFRALGTLCSISILTWTESLKWEHRNDPMQFATLWLLAFNIFGMGTVLLCYCILHLVLTRSSRRLPSTLDSSVLHLKCLPFSILLGFILPTFLMCWTGFLPEIHQQFMNYWQLFPAWMLISQYSAFYLSKYLTGCCQRSNSPPLSAGQLRTRGWHALRRPYIFGIAVAAFCHIPAITLVTCTMLFPQLFTPETVLAFNWRTVFIPPNFLRPVQIHSLSEGMLVFLQYDSYCGSLATIIWATYLTHEVKRGKSGLGLTFEQMNWIKNKRKDRSAVVAGGAQIGLLLRTLAMIVLLGNGATILILMFEKDRLVRGHPGRIPSREGRVRLQVPDESVERDK